MINVFWWSRVRDHKEELENFGDCLVPYLLERTTTEKFRWIVPNRNRTLRIFNKKKHYLIIGSILRKATEHSIIWGAGIMFHNSEVPKAKFLLVRGPLTRNRLLQLGYNVPERYGDPALLISLFNFPKANKKFKVGIVPHYLDYAEVIETFSNNSDIKVINLLTNDPQNVIDEIMDCELLLSSSLHGIIVGHGVRIPTLWMKISDKLGDDIKFHDYYESVKMNYSIVIPLQAYALKEIKQLFVKHHDLALPKEENLNKLVSDLIETFPFKKSKKFKDAIVQYFNENSHI